MRNEWNRALRLKHFEVTKAAQKVSSIEAMIADIEGVVAALSEQIAAEEVRQG
jgi:hypothetical protein